MHRREMLTLLRKKSSSKAQTHYSPFRVGATLDPYSGPFEFTQAAHLLRRTLFGPTYQEIQEAVGRGLEATLSLLLDNIPARLEPLNQYFDGDSAVPIGSSWADVHYGTSQRGYRKKSLSAWLIKSSLEQGITIRDKMTLFWHHHFVVAEMNDANQYWMTLKLFENHLLGNFRALTKDITILPSMLRYLDGNQNTKRAPNENYARELLELFTVGKGDTVGPGDYSTFTEQDVIEMSRVLTGWKERGNASTDPMVGIESFFRESAHDDGAKVLSHRFNDTVINDMGDTEYQHLIDLIFEQRAVALNICRRLYRWFIYYHIDEGTERSIIDQMAQTLIDNDYEIKPVVRQLLSSEVFFEPGCIGCMIKNPLDYTIGTVRQFEMTFDNGLTEDYHRYNEMRKSAEDQGMMWFEAPEVAGWKAYYQPPGYYQYWISSSTLNSRLNFVEDIILGTNVQGSQWKLDVLEFITIFPNVIDPNAMINNLAAFLYPQALLPEQIEYLKEVLLPGLPDMAWSTDYAAYLDDPDDQIKKETVEKRLQELLIVMLTMPEHHLG